jgi:serine phosphatase RsbU (regulator of sigma subunit)
MASCDSHRPPRAPVRRLAVVFAIGCCALACDTIAAAPVQAHGARAVPTATSLPAPTEAEAALSSEGAAAPAASQPAAAEPHGEVLAAKQQVAAGQSEAAAKAKKEKPKKEKEKPKNKKEGKKGKKGTGGEEKSQESGESPSSGSTKGGNAKGASETVATAASSPATQGEGESSAPVAAVASAAASPQIGLTKGSAVSAHSVRASAPAEHGRARRAEAAVVPAAAAVASAVGIPAAAAQTDPTHGAPALAATGVRRAQERQSPIVTTITNVVGVVPTAVRILIALLVALALALAVRTRLAARRTRRLEHQRGQLLEDVGLLQAALLPAPPERLGPVGTSVAYRPADGPGAGGDFYDVFALEDGQLAVIVGDVSGHGRGALPHTALLRFTIRAYLEAGLSPRRALQTAGSVLERQLGGSFATVVAATYHPRERTLTYSCAGHPPPVVLGPLRDGEEAPIVPVTACSSPPIGTGMRTGMRQTVVSVPGAAQICFYTDGVTEARVGGELYGDARLARGLRTLGAEATASALLDSVAEEADARPDDMAACVLRVEGGRGAPVVLCEELELDHEEAAGKRTEQFLAACGVEPWEVAEVVQSARSGADHRDTVILELRFADGSPAVALRHDNVIHPAALVAASGS